MENHDSWQVNGPSRSWSSSSSCDPQQVAVEVNLQLVPRQEHAAYQLSAGDEVEIVTLVGGG